MSQRPRSTQHVSALAAHDALVRQLRRPGACAGQPEAATLIDTHLSSLLVAGDQVFKLKKPVAFGFVDFTTLAARRDACEQELRLNRRTAPRWYLDLLPVRGHAEGACIEARTALRPGAAGPPLDWVVHMRRFDDGQRLDRLASQGLLTPTMVDALAAVVARFHAQQSPAPPGFGRAETNRHWARENLAELATLLQAPDDLALVAELQRWTESEGHRLAPLMDLRCRTGHVREVHGDLHLANIVWADGAPVLFDALEFNDTLRHIDTIGDLAFTFMDLLAHDLPRLAWRFVSAVLDASGDHAALPLLGWWAAYRAAVRAKVALLGGPGEAAQARRYLALAQTLVQPAAAGRLQLVLTGGLSGAGKSRVAAALAERLGAVRLRSDVERKRLFALPPDAHVAVPGLYDAETTRRTYDRLGELAATALQAGIPVVVDAASLLRDQRAAMRALAARCRAGFTLLWCEAPPAVLLARVQARLHQGVDPSDATPEVLAQQQCVAEFPGDGEAADLLRLDTDLPLAWLAQRLETLPLHGTPAR
jgi:hypothetical protein